MKHSNMTRLWMPLLAVVAATVAGCKDDGGGQTMEAEPFLEVSAATVDFQADADPKEVSIATNVETWSVSKTDADATWIAVEKFNKKLLICLEPNTGRDVRQATLTVAAEKVRDANALRKTITVRQLGTGKTILVAPEAVAVPSMGGKVSIVVTTNVAEFKISGLPRWIAAARNKQADLREETRTYTVGRNSGESRQATIVVGDTETTARAQVVVTQTAESGYVAGDTEGMAEDIKVAIVSGTATHDTRPGAPFRHTWDGKSDTDEIFLCGAVEDLGAKGVSMTWDLEETAESVNYLVYNPGRASNGRFGRCKIAWRARGEEAFRDTVEHNFGEPSSPAIFTFPKPLENPAAVQIIAYSGSGGLVSCNEMEFYAYNPARFDPSALFADATCAELRSGVTEAEIEACPVSLYRNMAYYMFHDKYEREFRIAKYRAYPSPGVQSGINRTSQHGRNDNATGIVARAGQPMVVFASETAGQGQVSVRVQNLDVADGDGYGGPSYALRAGYNRFTPDRDGLCYILYNTGSVEAADAAPEVLVHFASGTVRGFYDSQNPAHRGRWHELLNKSDYKFFDLRGEYSMCTFPTASFKQYTTSGDALIAIYDTIMKREMEFMGLFKYEAPGRPRVFRNRAYLQVIYKSFMYAAGEHTGYNVSTMSEVASDTRLKENAIWGPAHEIGHVNQTRPLLRWIGLTEVTNNLFCLYVQTKMFGSLETRLTKEGKWDNGLTNKFSAPSQNHAQMADVFEMLIPFWQLHLYLQETLGKTGFYHDMFEMARTKALPQAVAGKSSADGEYQLNFVAEACAKSGVNLLPFFRKWGFGTPVNTNIGDYGNAQVLITKERWDEVVTAIDTAKLQTQEHNFEYITDSNQGLFKSDAPMTPGTATVNGSNITVRGGANVAAWEVTDAKGNILKVATSESFTCNHLPDGFKIRAVPAKGAKVDVAYTKR